MVIGRCKLCLAETELLKSHIIPNAVFKKIKEEGKTVHLTSGKNSKARVSVKTYKEHMLCQRCEQKLSNGYEKYSIDFFKGRCKRSKIIWRNNSVRIIGLDLRSLYFFVLSVFWRASVSTKQEFFTKVVFPDSLSESIRSSVLSGKENDDPPYALQVSRIVCDVGPGELTGDEIVKSIVMLPFCRLTDEEASFHWVALGFLFTFRVRKDGRFPLGSTMLRRHGGKLTAPLVNMREIPELMDVLANIHDQQ